MGTEERPRDQCQRVMQQMRVAADFFMRLEIQDFAGQTKGFDVARVKFSATK